VYVEDYLVESRIESENLKLETLMGMVCLRILTITFNRMVLGCLV
jgi:hypothetical protein